MLTPEQVAALRDLSTKITDPINDYLLTDIARRVAEAGQLTSTAAYQIWVSQNLGKSQRAVEQELRRLLKLSHREIRQLMTQAAEVGYAFDIKNLPQAQAVRFQDNALMQQIVSAAAALAEEDFTNLTKTLGMVDPFGRALPLQAAYRSCTDFAFQQVFTGAADYNTAIRRATRHLADSGVLTIDYSSQVHTTIEAATRRNLMSGLGLMQEQISQRNHDAFGADGWEISAHAACAPDHEPIQGHQYTDAEYRALNDSLMRRIGTLNCGHAAFPIVLGSSKPQWTKQELSKLREDNENGVFVDGKHYSTYEATQMQRKIERSIRKQKRRVLVDQATGDLDSLSADRSRLTVLNQEYKRFSAVAGIRTEAERLEVAKIRVKKEHLPQQHMTDVLEQYLQSAVPGTGRIEFSEGYKRETHRAEDRMAQWLHDNLGGDVVLLQEVNQQHVCTADFVWRGKLWDLKTATTEKSANSSIRHGLKQISDNPGGIILDFEDRTPDLEELWRVVDKRMGWYKAKGTIDILAVSCGKLAGAKRY